MNLIASVTVGSFRWEQLCWLAAGVAMGFSLTGCATHSSSSRVYIGTFSQSSDRGIYTACLDGKTGQLSAPELAAVAARPGYLALHPHQPALYAVGEMESPPGSRIGAVSAFALDADHGRLTLLNQQPSGGRGPCHLAVDASGLCLLVANYSDGTVATLPVKADGSLGQADTVIQHQGSGPNAARQKEPHAHFITADPANRFALACDLGADRVFVYELTPATAGLTPASSRAVALAPGAGPRHLAFHPNGKFVYVVNELNSTVTALAYRAEAGELQNLQTVSTLPPEFTGANTCAAIKVHPTGQFVYASNRGHDSLARFTVDQRTGKLTFAGTHSTSGRTPRDFGIDPTGRWLLAANQATDNVVVFGIDPETGQLRATGQEIHVPAPGCVIFQPLK